MFELEGFNDLVECIFLITNNGIHNYKILLNLNINILLLRNNGARDRESY
jgi:hypothetical protein